MTREKVRPLGRDCIYRKLHGLTVNEPIISKACHPVLLSADNTLAAPPTQLFGGALRQEGQR